ncbi:MAG: hypothetical protein WKG07_11805 [Hymenobacter sp.]
MLTSSAGNSTSSLWAGMSRIKSVSAAVGSCWSKKLIHAPGKAADTSSMGANNVRAEQQHVHLAPRTKTITQQHDRAGRG